MGGIEPRRVSLADFLAELEAAGPAQGAAVLVAFGGFGVMDHDRVGAFEMTGDTLRLLADAYVERGNRNELVQALAGGRSVRRGGWDTMFATPWALAWTEDGEPFALWDHDGLLCWRDGPVLLLRDAPPVDPALVHSVEAYTGPGWVERGVRLRLHDGSALPIARTEDWFAVADPTYDGLNLMVDTGWAQCLARALAVDLGVRSVDLLGEAT
jgi:hypothetical protein